MRVTFLIHRIVQKSACRNVNDHGVRGTILVVEVPHGHLGADVSQEACMDFMKQVSAHFHIPSVLNQWISTDMTTFIRSGPSARRVVSLDSSSPAPTSTAEIGSRPTSSSIPTGTAAKLRGTSRPWRARSCEGFWDLAR